MDVPIDNLKQRGFTLLELLVVIVVLGVGLVGLTLAMLQVTRGSVDPMTQQQAHAIAQAYLEEVVGKDFCDPDIATAETCLLNCTSSACGSSSCTLSDLGGRSGLDDVCDYDGLNQAPTDQNGNSIAALNQYTAQVTVVDSGVNLNGLTSAAGQVVRIDVQVTGPNNADSRLSAYRTNYRCDDQAVCP